MKVEIIRNVLGMSLITIHEADSIEEAVKESSDTPLLEVLGRFTVGDASHGYHARVVEDDNHE